MVTCFFIDTSTNVLDYLHVFSTLLKPGGLWINHGPLEVSIRPCCRRVCTQVHPLAWVITCLLYMQLT